ncbi:MAG: hypothetical protein ACXW2P_02085, partial [Thermoanaerobaculia bacterium]
MKKACAVPLALYLLTAAVIGALVYRRFPMTSAALMSAFIGGFFVFLGFAYLFGIRGRIGEARMIRRAESGLPPRDGERVAAIGRLAPTGAPVTAPFSKSTAVACKYEIQSHAGEDVSTLYSGFVMNPCAISGRHGRLRLLAYPDLKVPSVTVSSPEAQRNAETYVASTTFREASPAKLREAFAEMMALYKDDDGTIRHDQKNAGAEGTDLSLCEFHEWIVKPGERVCVIGRYSSQRGGIVYDPKNPLDQVKIEIGEPEVFARRAIWGGVRWAIAGVVILVLAAGALAAFLANVPLEASEQMKPGLRVSWPEVRLERWIETRVRTPMRAAGMLGTSSVANELAAGTANGRVNDIAVTTAEASRDGATTTVHIGDDAIVLTLEGSNRLTGLRLQGREIPRERWPEALDL